MNLTKYVIVTKNGLEFDMRSLESDVAFLTRCFDNMIEVNVLPIPKIAEITKNTRAIGLGIMGLADVLYMLGVKYNSSVGIELSSNIVRTMKETAVNASVELAKERGCYKYWEGSEWHKKGIKIRNSNHISIAPTGTISFLANVSGGCEPNFGLCYTRKTYSGTLYYVVNPFFEEELKKRGLYSDALLKKVSENNGSCQGIKEIPKDMRDIFVVAPDIEPEDHIKMVSALQKHVDLSISKTANLPYNATIKDVQDVIILAWESGLKGFTVFRDGCRNDQVLSTAGTKKKDVSEPETEKYDYIFPIEKEDIGETYGTNVKKKVACGNLYINLCRNDGGDLVETFINTGKGGICQSNINALSRMVSITLRSGVKVDAIINQLSGIKCPACTILKSQGQDVQASCPDAIAKYLREKYDQGDIIIKETKAKQQKKEQKTDQKMICPNCGEKMRSESGCITCVCGFSKCG